MTTVLRNEPEDGTPGDEVPSWGPFTEVGATGLRRSSGYVDEEFLPALKGRKASKVYREMWDNSSVIGGWWNAVVELVRQLDWQVETPGNRNGGRQAGEFLEECMGDMEHAWNDYVVDWLSYIIFGFQLSELKYKLRRGDVDGRDHSQFKDGRVGWHSIPGRSQESIQRWIFDGNDNLLGAVQFAPPRYQLRPLPLGKMLHFRTSIAKNNPEGRSMLRNAYEPWYYLKRHQETEAIGVHRDLAGMPTAKVPSKILQAKPGTPDAAMREAIKKLVTSVSRNENEGILWPQDIDPDTKQPNYVFELLSSGGSRQFDTESIINRYKTEMLQSVVSDWLQVGHEENGGAYNMHTDKSGLFRSLTNGMAMRIADTINRQATPRLFRYNRWKLDELPRLVPSKVDPPDLTVLGGFLQQTAALGVQWFPDPKMEKFLRDAAGLPQLDERDEKLLEAQHRQAVILQVAQQKLQAIQVEQQAAQGQQQLVQGDLSTQQQAMGVEQQRQQLEAGPAQPGQEPVDPNEAKRSGIAVDTDKVKLAQEKQKLQNLKRQPAPAGRGAPARKNVARKTASRPVRKAFDAQETRDVAGRWVAQHHAAIEAGAAAGGLVVGVKYGKVGTAAHSAHAMGDVRRAAGVARTLNTHVGESKHFVLYDDSEQAAAGIRALHEKAVKANPDVARLRGPSTEYTSTFSRAGAMKGAPERPHPLKPREAADVYRMRALKRAIAASDPADVPALHRSMHLLGEHEVGDVIDFGDVSSFTSDKGVANEMGSLYEDYMLRMHQIPEAQRRVLGVGKLPPKEATKRVYSIPEGSTKALHIGSAGATPTHSALEYLAGGKFRVVAKKRVRVPLGRDRYDYELEPISAPRSSSRSAA